jgi:hypothetical protein
MSTSVRPLFKTDLEAVSTDPHDCRSMIPLQLIRELRLDDWAPHDPAHSTVVYACLSSTGGPLYVGITYRHALRYRLMHHRRRPWWPEVKLVRVLHCMSRRDAAQLESSLIRRHWPTYNIAQVPRLT